MNQWVSATSRSLLSIAILAAGLGGFLWLGTPEVPTQTPRPDRPPTVETAAAIDHTGGISFDVDGLVVPFRQIQIASQVAGRVEFKDPQCRVGREVRKGDLLLRIEPADYELEVRRLTEERTQAEAMIRELDAEILTAANQIESIGRQLEIDVRQLKRNQDLQRRSAASSSEVDAAQRAELTTRSLLQSQIDQRNLLTQRRIRMDAAKALVQANLEKAELSLERTEIRSPIDGVVVSESIEQDGYVPLGTTMLVLQDTSQLDVACKLHMRQMHWLWQGRSPGSIPAAAELGYDFPETPATVIYEMDGARYVWEGVVDRYDGAGLDAQTRMVPCRVHVDDPTSVTTRPEPRLSHVGAAAKGPAALVSRTGADGLVQDDRANDSGKSIHNPSRSGREDQTIRPDRSNQPPTLMTGMFVKVRIHARPPIALVRLPQEAIQPGNTVWVVEDRKLRLKEISIASADATSVVAYQQSGGLQAGDLVVTSPLATPGEGMAVSLATDPPPEKPGGPGGKGSWGGRP